MLGSVWRAAAGVAVKVVLILMIALLRMGETVVVLLAGVFFYVSLVMIFVLLIFALDLMLSIFISLNGYPRLASIAAWTAVLGLLAAPRFGELKQAIERLGSFGTDLGQVFDNVANDLRKIISSIDPYDLK